MYVCTRAPVEVATSEALCISYSIVNVLVVPLDGVVPVWVTVKVLLVPFTIFSEVKVARLFHQ